MDRFRQYLFERHSETTLRQWAKRLKYFRYFRAYGGHANDGDSLDVAYRYRSTEELKTFMGFLGIQLKQNTVEPPQPMPGVSYKGDIYANFHSLIPGTRWIEQPKHVEILGQKAFVWCEGGAIKVSLGEAYEVNESHVASAEVIETLLRDAPL